MSHKHQREELRKAISKHVSANLEQCISQEEGKRQDRVVGQVARSEAWRKFQKRYLLGMDLGGCCEDVIAPSGREDTARNPLLRRDSTSSIASFVSESSLSSEHIRELCNLLRSPSPSSKLHAVDILNSVASYENLVACREWAVLEEWIRSLLRHPSTVIKRETLRLFWAMLSSGGVVFEQTYVSLLRAARDQMCGGPNVRPLNVVELLNMYHRDLPRHWLRLPRKAVRHVIEEAFALMDDPVYGNFSRIWRSLAAVDGQAAWLASWLRGAESRAVVFQCLGGHANVVLHALQLVTNYRKFPDLCQRNVGSHVYGACVLLRVLLYEGGRKFLDSLSSDSEKTWFDVFTKVVHFAKVLWASKYEPFSGFVALMTGTVSKIASLAENPILPRQVESLVGSLAEWSKSSGQCSTHLMSECLGALCSSSAGLVLVTGSTYKGCRVPEIVLTSTKRAVSRGPSMCTRCVCNFLAASSRMVGEPGHLLTNGCSGVVRLLSSELVAAEELRDNVAAFVRALLSTCMGTALLCVGTIPESYESVVLDSADVPGKLRYCTVRTPPDHRREEQVASCASSCVWGPKRQLWASPEGAREQLLRMMSPYRQGKMLLGRRTCTLWSALLLQCPPDRPGSLPEEGLLLVALGVLKGLVCCLKTFLFLDCQYSLCQTLDELAAESCDSQGRLIVSEVTLKVKEIQQQIRSFSENGFPAPPHVFSTALGHRAANPIGLKRAGNNKKGIDGFFAGHKISAAGFWDLIDLEEGDRDSVRPSVRPLTAEQKRGIQMTVECGLNLGLLQSGHATNLEKLIHNGRHMYGASYSRDSFDFLLATVFLLLRGNVPKSYQLHKFLCDRDCYALYFHDMEGICDTLVCASLCQLFVLVLRDQLPRLYHAFRLHSYEPSNVLKHWVGQFFWGCLSFDEIAAVLLLVITVGGETLLFVCLSMLKHIEGEVLQSANQLRFIATLREARLQDFKLASYAQYIESLLEQYEVLVNKSLTMYAH